MSHAAELIRSDWRKCSAA